MAAGTETAVDTRTYNSPSIVGNIVEKVLIARQLAENERKFAEKKAAEAGTSLEEVGIEKGFFFKQALRGEFGGNFVDKKKKQLKNVVKKYKIAKRISKNPKVAFNFIKPIIAAKSKRKVSGAQTKMFRAKFDYTNYDEVTTATPKTPVVGATAKKIQKATTSRSKRISREELLSSITDIANALNKTAESIGRTTSGVSASVISSTNASMQLVEQLKTRNNTLEDKLNEIAKAISEQTQLQRQSVSRSKAAKAEERLENQTDVAATETPDDTSTAENETLIAQITNPTSPITNVQNISSSIGATSSQRIENQQMNAYNDIPQAESGGIISGPASGYLAKLHGDELIVPLKNNYTEGKKSAVDGKVRRRPSSNSSGGVTSSSLGGRFGFGIANMTGIGRGGSTQSSALTQPLIDAMSLIPMAVGGGTLAQLTSLMSSMGSEAPIIGPYIQQTSRSLANVFGLPSAIVNKATGKTKAKEGDKPKDKEEGESKKNILQKMMEGFGKLLENLGKGINNSTTPSGEEQPIDITDNEKELLKRLMIAEAGVEGVEGMAMVGQSVLNRASLIQSGIVRAGEFNADSGSITDVIRGEKQYQPYREGKLNRALSPEENAKAEEAYNLMLNQQQFRERIKSKFNLTDRQVQLASAATGFRNYDAGAGLDTSQQVNEFNAGAHTFNTAGNAGLRVASSDVNINQPSSPPPTPTPTPTPAAAKTPVPQVISQNWGKPAGSQIPFKFKGEDYYAERTSDGLDWEFYKKGAGLFGRGMPIKRTGNANQDLARAFIDFMNQRQQGSVQPLAPILPEPGSPDTRQSSLNPVSQSIATAQRISQPLNGDRTSLVLLGGLAETGEDTDGTVAQQNNGSGIGRGFSPVPEAFTYPPLA